MRPEVKGALSLHCRSGLLQPSWKEAARKTSTQTPLGWIAWASGESFISKSTKFSNGESKLGCFEALKWNVQYFMKALRGNVYLIWYVFIAKKKGRVGRMRTVCPWSVDSQPSVSLFRHHFTGQRSPSLCETIAEVKSATMWLSWHYYP